jgi:hypothetical protein
MGRATNSFLRTIKGVGAEVLLRRRKVRDHEPSSRTARHSRSRSTRRARERPTSAHRGASRWFTLTSTPNLRLALMSAETGESAAPRRAHDLLDRLPALNRRRLTGSYADLAAFKLPVFKVT